jgi:hypothetical protein
MDPRFLPPDQWNQLSLALAHFFLFVGLVINTALAFLLAHAVIPSLVNTSWAAPDTQGFRRFLYPIFVISGVLAAITLGRGLYVLIQVLHYFYPRFAI